MKNFAIDTKLQEQARHRKFCQKIWFISIQFPAVVTCKIVKRITHQLAVNLYILYCDLYLTQTAATGEPSYIIY